VNYVEADKVVLRLTRREAREVLLALACRLSAQSDVHAQPGSGDEPLTATSTRVVELIYRRIQRSWETKWPEVGQ